MTVKPIIQTCYLNVEMTIQEFDALKQLYEAIVCLLDNTEDDTCNGRKSLKLAFERTPELSLEHQQTKPGR